MRKTDGKILTYDGVSSVFSMSAALPIYPAQAEEIRPTPSLSKSREDPSHNWIEYWIDLGGEG